MYMYMIGSRDLLKSAGVFEGIGPHPFKGLMPRSIYCPCQKKYQSWSDYTGSIYTHTVSSEHRRPEKWLITSKCPDGHVNDNVIYISDSNRAILSGLLGFDWSTGF
jgi:hypothetical protein